MPYTTQYALSYLSCCQGQFSACAKDIMLMSELTSVGSDAGWLGLMIAEERVDMFAAVHNAMLQVLKVSSTDALPSFTCFSYKGLDMYFAAPFSAAACP